MTEEQQILADITEIIAEMPKDKQETIQRMVEEIKAIIAVEPGCGGMAIGFIGASLSAAIDTGTQPLKH